MDFLAWRVWFCRSSILQREAQAVVMIEGCPNQLPNGGCGCDPARLALSDLVQLAVMDFDDALRTTSKISDNTRAIAGLSGRPKVVLIQGRAFGRFEEHEAARQENHTATNRQVRS